MYATANAPPREAVQLRVTLPKDLADLYEIQAQEDEIPVESKIVERLQACVYYEDDKPLYFNDQQRRELDSLLKRNVQTSEKALAAIRAQLTADVSGFKVQISPDVLKRMKSRCFGKPFEVFFKETVNKLLEEFVMMR